jgi:hypothetical protein
LICLAQFQSEDRLLLLNKCAPAITVLRVLNIDFYEATLVCSCRRAVEWNLKCRAGPVVICCCRDPSWSYAKLSITGIDKVACPSYRTSYRVAITLEQPDAQ